MKFKYLIPLFCLSFSTLFSSLSQRFSFPVAQDSLSKEKKDSEKDNKKNVKSFIDAIGLAAQEPGQSKKLDDQTKSIEITSANLVFDKTFFGGANYFYLGAYGGGLAGTDSAAVVRAYIQSGQNSAENRLHFAFLAPQKVVINEQKEEGSNKFVLSDNPIFNKRVENLTIGGRLPIVTVSTIPVPNPDQDNKFVYMIMDFQNGRSIKTNTIQINDAAGNPTAGIVGLAAYASNVINTIAAVRPQGGNFGDPNSGFALVIQNEKGLKPVNAVTGDTAGNLAVKLDLSAGQLLAIDKDVTIDGLGGMYWDNNLNRLFIAIRGVERTDSPGGGISILVGRLSDKNVLSLEPIVELNKDLFVQDSDKFILGFYYTAGDINASCYKVRTMHTSTDYSYLIVNGKVADGQVKNRIYALPIIQEENEAGGVEAKDIGKIANKNDFSILPVNSNDMSQDDQDPVVVGGVGNNPLISDDQDIQDMFVVGDSVFICVAQDRSSPTNEAGIFQSCAIFDKDGKIRSWTPFQRVMGSIDRVYGGGLDSIGNYWYLTDNDDLKNVVKVTQWGKSTEKPGLLGNGLVELMGEEFERKNAGVHQMFNFDEQTPCLARTNLADQISFMVATGFEKIALIKTGQGSPFTPTQEKFQTESPENVYVWSDEQALKDVGPICCADVSRIAQADSGWLFVGGHDGVAVLRDSNGAGWNGDPSAAQVDLSQVADFTFKLLKNSDDESFFQVRKLVCDGRSEYLYIMTADKLYRVLMNQNKFADTSVALDEKEIAFPDGTFLDMLIVDSQSYKIDSGAKLLVATTVGLYVSDLINDTDENKTPIWTSILLHSGAPFLNPAACLNFVSLQKGGYTTNGNLYVLEADFSLNLANIYRFDVQDGQINAIAEPSGADVFYGTGELRSTFLTDGAYGYNQLSKQFGATDFLRRIYMNGDQNSKRSSEINVDLDVDDNAYNFGLIVKNTASGAWIIPCDQGIRGND